MPVPKDKFFLQVSLSLWFKSIRNEFSRLSISFHVVQSLHPAEMKKITTVKKG